MTNKVQLKLLTGDYNEDHRVGDIVSAELSSTYVNYTVYVTESDWYVRVYNAGCFSDGSWTAELVSADSHVEHPTHYNAIEGMPEVWDILDAFFSHNPLLWNAGKYLLRAGKKEGNVEIQELEKMVQYAQRRIDKLKEVGTDD